MSFKSALSKIIFISVSSIAVFNCKDDEVAKPTIEFATKSLGASEVDSVVFVNFVLDKPAPEEITVKLLLGGTATAGKDFECPSTFKVSKGSKTAKLQLKILNDGEYEGASEVVYVYMAESNGANLDTKSPLILKISEDVPDFKIDLTWVAEPATSSIDMNLFLFWKAKLQDEWKYVDMSRSVGSFETIELWSTKASDGIYGIACEYLSGDCKLLTFKVNFNCLLGKLESSRTPLVFTGQYTNANINRDNGVHITQTFIKKGFNYSSFSPLSIPASGSRVDLIRSTSSSCSNLAHDQIISPPVVVLRWFH